MYIQLFGGGAIFISYFCKPQLMMNGWMGGATTSSTAAAAERWSANSQHRQSVSSSYYAQQQQQQQQFQQQQQQQTRWAEASSRQVRAVRAPLKYVRGILGKDVYGIDSYAASCCRSYFYASFESPVCTLSYGI